MSGLAARPVRIVGAVPLACAGALVGFTLLLAFARPHPAMMADPPRGAVARTRLLRFADRADGAVLVGDDRRSEVITGQNGFLRATMSGLARIRRENGIGAQPPFRLTEYADHRLVLDDPATGKSIELEAFGPTNADAFARLLPLRPGS